MIEVVDEAQETRAAYSMRMPFTLAYAELTRAQKSPAGVSLYSRYVNRKLGRVFAAVAASLGLRPNTVTAVSGALIGVAVILLVAIPPGVAMAVGVAGLLVLSFALDAADGQLARLLRAGSPSGEWLDHVVDAAKGVSLHGGVLVAAYRFLDVPPWWLAVPLLFQLVAVVTFSGGTLRELIGRVHALPRSPRSSGSRGRAVLLLPADSGVIGLSFLALAWTPLFVVVYPALLVANLGISALLMVKWRREL